MREVGRSQPVLTVTVTVTVMVMVMLVMIIAETERVFASVRAFVYNQCECGYVHRGSLSDQQIKRVFVACACWRWLYCSYNTISCRATVATIWGRQYKIALHILSCGRGLDSMCRRCTTAVRFGSIETILSTGHPYKKNKQKKKTLSRLQLNGNIGILVLFVRVREKNM